MQSDCFYNAGWTTDTRDVINYLHHEYPKAPLFAIGTSIGANILVLSFSLMCYMCFLEDVFKFNFLLFTEFAI